MRKKRHKPRNVAMVSELKAGLSGYLAQVKNGTPVIITERGRTIAKIVPVPAPENDMEERTRELERQGRIIVNGEGRVPPEFWSLPLPPDPEGLVLKGLLQDREEGW